MDADLERTAHMATTTLKVEGMTCGACTSAVESGFEGCDGIGSVSVSLVTERCVVVHDPQKATAEFLKDTIEDRGFDAEVLSSDVPLRTAEPFEDALFSAEEELHAGPQLFTTTVSVGGMTCGACTSAVEGAFKDVGGIASFNISLLSERAVIEHDPTIISAQKIAEEIEDVGFDADIVESTLNVSRTKASMSNHKTSGTSRVVSTVITVDWSSCADGIATFERKFHRAPGVLQVKSSRLAGRCVVTHDPSSISAEEVVSMIENMGFEAKIVSSRDSEAKISSSVSNVQLKLYGLHDSTSCQNLESVVRSVTGVSGISIDRNSFRAYVSFAPSIVGLRTVVEAIEAAGYNALLAESDDNNAQLASLAKTKEIQAWRRDFRISLAFAIPVFFTSMILPMFTPALDFGSIKLPLVPGLWLGDVVCLILTIPVQFGIGKRFYVSAFKSLKHGSPTMDVLVILGTSAAFFFSVAAMLVSILAEPHSRPTTVFDTSTMLITFITFGRYLENRAKSQTSRALSRLMSLAPSMATIYEDPIAAEKVAEEAEGELNKSVEAKRAVESSEFVNPLSKEVVVATELIQIADAVILRPGDKVPADGTVIRGESYVDESMVTGEPMPILKKRGSALMAGTVNGAARLEFVVTRAGRDTQLSQIVRLVQEAQTNRAPIQMMADLVAGYFVPIIISLGVITFVGWMVLSHVLTHPPHVFSDHESGGRIMVCLKLCISVIVFACPCALGLSTPTAVMVGTGVGAEHGILVKGGAALETATKISHVVWDKTGTLTTGKMSVANVEVATPWNQQPWTSLWWTAIGLSEHGSEHPVGKAIVRAAKEALAIGVDGSLNGSVNKFDVVVGQGVLASTTVVSGSSQQSYEVLIGNAAFMESHGVAVSSPDPQSPTKKEAQAGATIIYTAINNTYAGCLFLLDAVKPSAAAAVTALSIIGIPSYIVTGDALPNSLTVASLLDIPASHVHASSNPSQKQSFVRLLQEQGHVVAMVGDGINDSPALATADVGISLSSGTDVAMEAADIVLMREDDLLNVPAALHLARTIFNRIKLNLAWACGYNLIGIPFAMGFFLPWGYSLHPMAAGAAMAMSSVSVVVSSLLLKFWKRPKWMKASNLEAEARRGPSNETWLRALKGLNFRNMRFWKGEATEDKAVYVPLSTVEEGV